MDLSAARANESELVPESRAVLAQPRTIAETGLALEFLGDLLLKHLYTAGVLDLSQLAERLALAGTILEAVLNDLRKDGRIEIRGAASGGVALRYALTERGRAAAFDALLRSGYVGLAPIPLAQYAEVVRQQSVHRRAVDRSLLKQALADVTVSDERLASIGPALNSGRAIMVYGLPGTGKTYICQRLIRALGDEIFLPYALAVGNEVVQYFDPLLHKPLPDPDPASHGSLDFDANYDRRFLRCRRPVAISGGELTLDMLEIDYDPQTKLYRAPIQLKANCGIYIVDDLGRQRVQPIQLLNRWIVPMEEQIDYLTLGSGKRFPVPFDVILVFSTNLDPKALADEAFLRRIGYKIHFKPVSRGEFETIWREIHAARQAPFDSATFEILMGLYAEEKRPLLPCHPRDLVGLMIDQCLFEGSPPELTPTRLRRAWDLYFVRDN